MTSPVLIFGYGNLSRGDDALGPLLLKYIEQNLPSDKVEVLADFQLQVEHALDLVDRQLVLFVDAAVNQDASFVFNRLQARRDDSYTTHAMSPAAVLKVFESIVDGPAPPAFLLSIAGVSFELGESLSGQAEQNLQQAISFVEKLLQSTDLTSWMQLIENARTVAA